MISRTILRGKKYCWGYSLQGLCYSPYWSGARRPSLSKKKTSSLWSPSRQKTWGRSTKCWTSTRNRTSSTSWYFSSTCTYSCSHLRFQDQYSSVSCLELYSEQFLGFCLCAFALPQEPASAMGSLILLEEVWSWNTSQIFWSALTKKFRQTSQISSITCCSWDWRPLFRIGSWTSHHRLWGFP